MYGSSQTQGQPYYNFTLILPLDEANETGVRIRTDCDFNLDGEVNYKIDRSKAMKTTFQLGDVQGNNIAVNLDWMLGDHSTMQFEGNLTGQPALTVNYMQAVL